MAKELSKEVVSDSDEPQKETSEMEISDSEVERLKGKTTGQKEAAQDSDSESEESEDSEDDSSSEEESSEPKVSTQEKPPQQTQPDSIPAQPYKAPPGFRRNTDYNPPSSAISSTLSNLNGKKLFHIAAPSFLPLSSIPEVSLANVLNGEPIITHKGVSYGISREAAAQSEKGTQALFMYDKSSSSYTDTLMREIPTYRLQEIINLPTNGAIPVNTTATDNDVTSTEVSGRGTRKQPKNLKMRFHPVGSGNQPPEILGSDSEGPDNEELTTALKASPTDAKKKRKGILDENSTSQAATETPRKKSRKHTTSAPENGIASSSQKTVREDGDEERGRTKGEEKEKHKTKKSKKDRNETSQERRERKEEKKRRKAEKAQGA